MKKFNTHLCFVSQQPTPNLTPVISGDFKPQKVILLVSEQMQEQAKWLEEVYKKHQVKTEIKNLSDINDIQKIQDEVLNVLSENENDIVLNITGGTKLMTIAASYVFLENEKPVFYVDAESNKIQFIQRNPNQHKNESDLFEIKTKLKLKDFLLAHGYDITNQGSQPTSNKHKNLTEKITKSPSLGKAITTLNRYIYEMKEKQKLSITIQENDLNDRDLDTLLDLFEKEDIFTLRGNELNFTKKENRDYAGGIWLEEHIAEIIRTLASKENITDWRMNLKAKSKKEKHKTANESKREGYNTENEFDVIFLSQNILHIIEVKTSNPDKDKANDYIYKLDSLSDIGGSQTKKMLISLRDIPEHTLERAKNKKIKTIKSEQLINLKSEIKNWINSK